MKIEIQFRNPTRYVTKEYTAPAGAAKTTQTVTEPFIDESGKAHSAWSMTASRADYTTETIEELTINEHGNLVCNIETNGGGKDGFEDTFTVIEITEVGDPVNDPENPYIDCITADGVDLPDLLWDLRDPEKPWNQGRSTSNAPTGNASSMLQSRSR